MFPDTLYGAPVVMDYGPRSPGDLTEYERVQAEAALPLASSPCGAPLTQAGFMAFINAIS